MLRPLIRLLCLLFPVSLSAGGFQVNTQGQKASAMGGSVSGKALDASTVFYNPGGMNMLDSNRLYINAGFSLIMPKTSFLSPYSGVEEMSSQLYTPFHLYASRTINSKWAAGLSVNTPFGLGSKWEDDWSGRYITVETRLNSIFIQPAVSYRITNKVSFGAGPVFGIGWAKLNRGVPVSSSPGSNGSIELKGGSSGFGFNAGLMGDFGKWTAGLDYRSEISFDIEDGEAEFSNIPSSLVGNGSFPSGSTSWKTSLTLPAVASAGLSYKVNDALFLTGDFNYTFWESYDQLSISFPDFSALNSVSPRKYDNSWAVRAGFQYRSSEKLTYRGGLAYDQSPVPDGYLNPELPDADKLIVSAGASYSLKNGLVLEGSFVFENLQERRENSNVEHRFNGTYKTYLYILGLGVQYVF